jgi:hypothetical protein
VPFCLSCATPPRAAVPTDLESVNAELKQLFALSDRFDLEGVICSLRGLVKEFTPSRPQKTITSLNLYGRTDKNSPKKAGALSAKVIPMRTKTRGANLTAHGGTR